VIAGSGGFNPAMNGALIEGWDASVTPPGAPGVIPTWTGINGTVGTFSGNPVTYSPTSMGDDEGGLHSGVAISGSLMTCPLGALVVGRTRLGVILGVENFTASTPGVLAEYGTPDATSANGQFAAILNIGGASSADYFIFVRGGGGNGTWTSPINTVAINTVAVPGDPFALSFVVDLNDTSGSTLRRVDNVETAGGTIVAGLVAGSVMNNTTLFIGARAGVMFPTSCQWQQIWLVDPDFSPTTMTDYARYVDRGMGEVGA
jgi:hypothetical protein